MQHRIVIVSSDSGSAPAARGHRLHAPYKYSQKSPKTGSVADKFRTGHPQTARRPPSSSRGRSTYSIAEESPHTGRRNRASAPGAVRERSEASAAREYSARSLRRKGLRSLRPQAALFSVRRASRKQPAAPHRRKGPERKSPLRTGGAMIHKTVCPRTARTPAGRPDAYMRSGTSMPSSPIAARSTRATCSASWRRMRRTAAASSRRIEWSW